MAETVTDKESIIVVEGKLEISGAVAETIFRADAETTLQLDTSDAANALLIMDGANTDTINLPGHHTINAAESQGRGGKVAYDPTMLAGGEQASAQSTSAENGFTVSKPSETTSGNRDHSAVQLKPSDYHAVTDPKINESPRSSLSTRPILILTTSSSLIMTTILARPHTMIRKSTTSLRSSLSTRPILTLIISSSLMTTAAPIQDTQPAKTKISQCSRALIRRSATSPRSTRSILPILILT
jgi:hypothetical protein